MPPGLVKNHQTPKTFNKGKKVVWGKECPSSNKSDKQEFKILIKSSTCSDVLGRQEFQNKNIQTMDQVTFNFIHQVGNHSSHD